MTAKSPHIIIIGAGLIGLSAADSLLRAGVRVTLIDAAEAPMRGASFSNSGMLHPSQAMPWSFSHERHTGSRMDAMNTAKDIYALGQKSVRLTVKRAFGLGLNMNRRVAGTRQVFDNEVALKLTQETYRDIGVPCERASPHQNIPNLPTLFFPEDKSGNAYIYGMALAQDLAARGAVFINGQEAKPHMQSGRIVGVQMGGDIILADHVVLATGYKTAELAAELGVKLFLRGEAGYALNFRRPDNLDLPDTPVMDTSSRSALTVFGDVVRLSGTKSQDDASELLRAWTQVAPEIIKSLGESIGPEWRGIRPVSEVGRPYIGQAVVPGLWVNAGHGHMGWTLCSGSGELLADMILNGAEAPQFKLPN